MVVGIGITLLGRSFVLVLAFPGVVLGIRGVGLGVGVV